MSTVAETFAAWPPANPPEPTYLDDRLNYWAEADPEGLAMTFGGRAWNWQEWHDRVHRAAGGLRDLEIGRGDVVAFLDKKHSARLEITLAASSIGAANAIIDWRMDAAGIAQVLEECRAKVLFVGTEFLSSVAGLADQLGSLKRVIEVTPDGADCPYEEFLDESLHVGDGPDVLDSDVCMIRYNADETGQAEGLRLTHRDIIISNDAGAGLDFLPVLAQIHAGQPSTIEREDN
jgi:acyl-CoA synthetase (AMP-forming)/AMP-acid ligase II